MKKKKGRTKVDFETMKQQMLIYRKLGKTAQEAVAEINEKLSKDANVWQSSQQEQQI